MKKTVVCAVLIIMACLFPSLLSAQTNDFAPFGIGLNVGILPGLKIRYLPVKDIGFSHGVDLDIGYLIALFSGSLSYEGALNLSKLFRIYGQVGITCLGLVNITNNYAIQQVMGCVNLGMGAELRLISFIGLGAEGGYYLPVINGDPNTPGFLYARLTLAVYF